MALAPERETLEQAEIKARRIGRILGGMMPEGWQFALVISSKGEGGYATYISNGPHDEMIQTLRECAESLEENTNAV